MPGRPGLARRGARLVEVVKWALPNPPLPPFATHHALARPGEIGEQRPALLVEHLRSDWDFQHGVVAATAGAISAHPVHAGLGLEMLLVAKVDERVEAVRAFDHDVPAAPAVAPVRAAELNEFLAAERDRTRPAVA